MMGRIRIIGALLCGLLLAAGQAAAQNAFQPGGATVTLAVTGVSARVQTQEGSGSKSLRVYNAGTLPVFIQCGDATVVASVTTSMPILAGTVEVLSCTNSYVAGIVATGTATLYLTAGSGL